VEFLRLEVELLELRKGEPPVDLAWPLERYSTGGGPAMTKRRPLSQSGEHWAFAMPIQESSSTSKDDEGARGVSPGSICNSNDLTRAEGIVSAAASIFPRPISKSQERSTLTTVDQADRLLQSEERPVAFGNSTDPESSSILLRSELDDGQKEGFVHRAKRVSAQRERLSRAAAAGRNWFPWGEDGHPLSASPVVDCEGHRELNSTPTSKQLGGEEALAVPTIENGVSGGTAKPTELDRVATDSCSQLFQGAVAA